MFESSWLLKHLLTSNTSIQLAHPSQQHSQQFSQNLATGVHPPYNQQPKNNPNSNMATQTGVITAIATTFTGRLLELLRHPFSLHLSGSSKSLRLT